MDTSMDEADMLSIKNVLALDARRLGLDDLGATDSDNDSDVLSPVLGFYTGVMSEYSGGERSDEEVLLSVVGFDDGRSVGRALELLKRLARRGNGEHPPVSPGLGHCIALAMRGNPDDGKLHRLSNAALAQMLENEDSRPLILTAMREDLQYNREGVIQALQDSVERHFDNVGALAHGFRALNLVVTQLRDAVNALRVNWASCIDTAKRALLHHSDRYFQDQTLSFLRQFGVEDVPVSNLAEENPGQTLSDHVETGSPFRDSSDSPRASPTNRLWTPWIDSPQPSIRHIPRALQFSGQSSASPTPSSPLNTASFSNNVNTNQSPVRFVDCKLEHPQQQQQQHRGRSGSNCSTTSSSSPITIPDKAKKKKRKRDPNTPRGPRSAYVFFSQMQCEAVRRDHPSASPAELSKIMGVLWQQFPEEAKRSYNELADQDRQRYRRELAAHRRKLSESSDANMDADTAESRQQGEERRRREELQLQAHHQLRLEQHLHSFSSTAMGMTGKETYK